MKIVQSILSIVAVILIAYLSIMYFVSSQMYDSKALTWEKMKSSEFSCPEGMVENIEAWTKNGYSRSCAPLKHGKWEAWSEGYKNIDGYFDHGVKHGKWTWYHPDGSVYRIIEYDHGEEVTNQFVDDETKR